MTQSNKPPQTIEEVKTDIELAKKEFDASMSSIKQEYKTVIDALEAKKIKQQIAHIWTDQNES